MTDTIRLEIAASKVDKDVIEAAKVAKVHLELIVSKLGTTPGAAHLTLALLHELSTGKPGHSYGKQLTI